MSDPLRVLVVDDHPIFRNGLKLTLSSIEGLEVAGEAASGEEAVKAAATIAPDVVLMDISMPGISGVEATRQITRANPGQAVLMLTMFEDTDSVLAAMRAGARGYVVKGSGEEEIVRAIRAVAIGEAIFSAPIARQVISHFASPPGRPVAPFPELTERELQVLELIASGAGNQAIAARLEVSQKTVRNHISNVFTKLQVTSRAEAIVKAREAGMGQRD